MRVSNTLSICHEVHLSNRHDCPTAVSRCSQLHNYALVALACRTVELVHDTKGELEAGVLGADITLNT